ncbi:protein BatD [Desulfuromonas acetoxidans]|uniref:DUF7939 domain-containing protein n=1 Tax=Desulfuromonas acetoxidans (strain DSM 684 / 11070) TaxID=281689 RepID=Q1K436_DESA6|nr:BatD family protein [Desulfuromonas acetoxidans]EAT17267.1 conserved hypothetical protein [Desulfuromonas acetoxidans DSM 684]MBF0646141.1 protein BatD [Desulfuromonas acetoxidans]NVD25952.1 protein BatD [Desulfuromonas acetoxidans]NVE15084.1 protein BatD [Desulfuromonas acetoxidans]
MVGRLLLTLVLLLCTLGSSWAEISVSASRNQLSINDSLVVEIVLSGDNDGDPDLAPLEKDFEIRGRSQSSQIQIINGEMNRSTKWSLSLTPRRSGTLTIPPLCSGQECSQPVSVTVMPQTEQDVANADVLVEVESQPAERTVVQGQVLYTVRLLLRQPVAQASLSPPQPQGVETLVQKLGEDQRSETYRNGWRYQVIERHYALFPQQSGKLHLPPLEFEAVLQNGRNPFDLQSRIIRQRSNSLDLQVNPPASTEHPWLPALGLRLEDDWQQQPPTLTVGEPATRTITVRGAGVTAAQLPEFALKVPQGFKSYPDQPAREDVSSPTGLSGVLVQKVAVVPTHAGRFELPPLSLYWWDITAARWREETLPAISVDVLPAERQATALPAPSVLPDQEPPAPSPVAPKSVAEQTLPTPQPQNTIDREQPLWWQWTTAACAVGWLITAVLWWRQRRQKQPTAATPPSVTMQSPSQGGKAAVVKAAQTNDARATYDALCQWGQHLASGHVTGADYWQECGDAQVAEEVLRLQRCLYADNHESWQGGALIDALKQWTPTSAEESATKLPSFYPQNRP